MDSVISLNIIAGAALLPEGNIESNNTSCCNFKVIDGLSKYCYLEGREQKKTQSMRKTS